MTSQYHDTLQHQHTSSSYQTFNQENATSNDIPNLNSNSTQTGARNEHQSDDIPEPQKGPLATLAERLAGTPEVQRAANYIPQSAKPVLGTVAKPVTRLAGSVDSTLTSPEAQHLSSTAIEFLYAVAGFTLMLFTSTVSKLESTFDVPPPPQEQDHQPPHPMTSASSTSANRNTASSSDTVDHDIPRSEFYISKTRALIARYSAFVKSALFKPNNPASSASPTQDSSASSTSGPPASTDNRQLSSSSQIALNDQVLPTVHQSHENPHARETSAADDKDPSNPEGSTSSATGLKANDPVFTIENTVESDRAGHVKNAEKFQGEESKTLPEVFRSNEEHNIENMQDPMHKQPEDLTENLYTNNPGRSNSATNLEVNQGSNFTENDSGVKRADKNPDSASSDCTDNIVHSEAGGEPILKAKHKPIGYFKHAMNLAAGSLSRGSSYKDSNSSTFSSTSNYLKSVFSRGEETPNPESVPTQSSDTEVKT